MVSASPFMKKSNREFSRLYIKYSLQALYLLFTRARYMQNSRSGPSEILCQHCGKKIIAANYLLHQARCTLMSSRARVEEPPLHQQKPEEKPQQYRERPQPRNPLGSIRRQPEAERKKIFNSEARQEEEERIPCTYCGYKQTFLELDTHPNECPANGKPCTYCGQSFPQSLMEEHQQVCSARVPPQPHNHIHHQGQYPDFNHQIEEGSDEDERSYHPFGNFNFLFGNNQPSYGRQPVFRRMITVNGRTIIEESDGRGGIMRTQTFSNNGGNRGQEPGFQNIGREELFNSRRNSSAFSDFFRILQMMALRSGGVQQGLTKEQIKNLVKIKYKPNANSGEKDLCTICYCEFQQNERIIQLKCKHMYHEQCIVKWLEKNAKCPVCKAPQTNRPIFREDD